MENQPEFQQVLREKLASGLADESDIAGIVGAPSVNTRVYQASSVDTSSVTFSFTPSRGALMSRRVIFEFPVIVTHTAGGGQLVFQPSFAPSQYAGLQAVRQFSLTLNNADFKAQPSDFLSAWSRYHLDEDQVQSEAEFMASPDYQDPDASCPLYAMTAANNNTAATLAAARQAASVHDRAGNPYAISDYGCAMPNRASTRFFTESGVGTATITRVYTFRVPVFVNDLLDMAPGRTLANITSFDLNVDFMANLATSCFQNATINDSGIDGKGGGALYNQVTGTAAAVQLTSAMVSVGRALNAPSSADFKLYVSYLECPVQIPQSVSYEYSRFEHHQYTLTESGQAAGVVRIGASATTLSGDLSFSMVPKAVYVFAVPRASGQRMQDAKCFMKTTSLEINLGSQRVNYQNAEEIRELCLENGMYAPNLSEYNGVVKLVYGKDLPVPDTGMGPAFIGAPVTCQLNLQATHQNLCGQQKSDMVMHIVVEYPARVSFQQNMSETIQGLTGAEEQALSAAPLDIKSMIGDSALTHVQGGKLRLGKIKSFIKKHFTPKGFHKAADGIISVLRKAESVVDEGARVVDEVHGSVNRIQGKLGGQGSMHGGQVIGGAMHKQQPPLPRIREDPNHPGRYLKFK